MGVGPAVAMRTGIGIDAHRLVVGRPLIVGGVHVPFDKGLEGHSDGDVLLHAIADALLGAAALGDLGDHFPSERAELKDIASMKIIAAVGQKVREAGYRVANIDSVIIAQRPRLKPFVAQMREGIARALEIGEDRVSVKATSTDHLGFAGREEGIAAQAVVTLEN